MGSWSGRICAYLGRSSNQPRRLIFELLLTLMQFGFDNDDKWMTRRDTLLTTLHSNPKAQFVTRAVQFGSEPLFDNVLSPINLATQITAAKANLSSLSIPVIISELAYGYQAVRFTVMNDGLN